MLQVSTMILLRNLFQNDCFGAFGVKPVVILLYVIIRPRSDLCTTCQQHYTSGAKMAMASDEEKMETIRKMTAHLDLVAKE
jgi:hypothetical protein